MGFIWNNAVDPGDVRVKQNQYAKDSGIAPQYQLIIYVEGDESLTKGVKVFPMVCSLPERYNLAVSSQWDAPFANKSMSESVGMGENSATWDMISSGIGIGTRSKLQMAQVWQSSTPISFNIDLVFNAKTNTKKDIQLKHLGLLKLAAPSEILGGTMLLAPGPNIVASGLTGRKISLYIGTYIVMENVIVKSVSSDVQTICGQDGIPHSMTINVEFESFYAGTTTNDLEKMFQIQGGE